MSGRQTKKIGSIFYEAKLELGLAEFNSRQIPALLGDTDRKLNFYQPVDSESLMFD